MSYEAGILYDRVYYVRWTGRPSPVEFDGIVRAISDQRKLIGKPIVFLNIVPSEVEVPDDDVRDSLDRFATRLRDHLQFSHVVVEGTGFKAAAQRSRVTANWQRRKEAGWAMLHTTVEEALRRIAADAGLDGPTLQAAARAKNLIPAVGGGGGAPRT